MKEAPSSEIAGNTNSPISSANLPVETSVVVSGEVVVTDKMDDIAEEVVSTATQSPVDVDNVSDAVVTCGDRHLGASAVSNNSVILPSHNKGT